MRTVFRTAHRVIGLVVLLGFNLDVSAAQEHAVKPSTDINQPTQGLARTLPSIEKRLEAATKPANEKLKQVLSDERRSDIIPQKNGPSTKIAENSKAEASSYVRKSKRDPFRPYSERLKPPVSRKALDERMPPLLRYEISEFKLLGIAGYHETREWKALILAPDTRSYAVGVGANIGPHKGQVKAITSTDVVFQENSTGQNSIIWSCRVGNLCSKPSPNANKRSD